MKLIKIIGHPVLVMSIFLLILISSEKFGGFYLLYLIMGLPHGAPHTLIALAGLLAMLIGYKIHPKQVVFIKPLLYMLGDLLMVTALIIFFSSSKGNHNSTFEQTVPLTILGLFGVCVLSNLLLIVSLFLKLQGKNDKQLKAAT
jgi:hypothetical protein